MGSKVQKIKRSRPISEGTISADFLEAIERFHQELLEGLIAKYGVPARPRGESPIHCATRVGNIRAADLLMRAAQS